MIYISRLCLLSFLSFFLSTMSNILTSCSVCRINTAFIWTNTSSKFLTLLSILVSFDFLIWCCFSVFGTVMNHLLDLGYEIPFPFSPTRRNNLGMLQGMARVTHVPYVSHTLNPFCTGIANRKPRVLIYIEHTANRPGAE